MHHSFRLGHGKECANFASMADLFDTDAAAPEQSAAAPLATRMRPRSLDEYAGQEHILGPGKLLRRAIEADRISSIILFGPPGTGKTALARIIAVRTKAHFEWLNAATAGLDDLRKVINAARSRRQKNVRTILFL